MMQSPALIPFDCADDEIGPIFKRALNDLRRSAEEIIGRANKQIDECQKRLSSYDRRLSAVEKKFETMEKSDEVPLITSPAEFPGTVHMGRALVFSRSICSTPFTTQQDLLKTDHFSRSQSIKEMVLSKNGYRFIFPKGKYTEVLNPKKNNNQFNASERKKRGFIRPEDFYNLKFTSQSDVLLSNFEFASKSLLIYDNLRTIDSSDPFTYKPGIGNLTEFDLPDVLPQLSTRDIHGNEFLFGGQFDDDEDDDIFGEVTKRNLDVDLSARSTFYMPDESVSRRSAVQSKIVTPTKSNEPSISGLSTPPSTGAIKQSTPIAIENQPKPQIPVAPPRNIDIETKNSVIPVAPPPPPTNILASIPSPPMPGRSDLMEAIRAAGGVKKAGLKKIENNENVKMSSNQPSKPSNSATESTDDLMSSLAKALERRRKGISGKTAKKFDALEKHQKPNTSAFSSLRELIPPPSNESDDSESNNEDDWK